MRTNATLKAWLDAGNNVSHRADLVTLTTRTGTSYRWTTSDIPLVVGGQTYGAYGAGAPLVVRGPYRQSARLAIDTLDLTLQGNDFTIGGKSLPRLGVEGFFDGATIQVDHLVMPTPGDVSLGPISSWFAGRVSQVAPQGPNLALRCKSHLESLNVLLPRFLLSASCGNMVYDANCGLDIGDWIDSGTLSGSTSTTITTASAVLTAKAAGYYNLGVLGITSGALAGTRRAVASWSGTVFTLALPLPSLPANGDAITVYPGCDRTRARCNSPFANLSRYRGFPHIPAPEKGSP